jgi:GT2 family glycosyltransferase
MDDLTISIGTIANIDGLEECLRTVFAEDDPNLKFKVSLILNGPQEEPRIEQLKTLFPQVHIIRSRHKLGWGRAHNQTLKKYNSRYVLLLDDDTILPKGTLPTMVRFMDAHPEVGIAGCKAAFPDGTFQKTFGLFSNLKTEFFHSINLPSFWPDRLYQNITGWREVEWLTGQLLIVRSEAIQQAGLLDEFYFTFVSEPDWCYRIHQAGWKVVHVPDVKIIHKGAELALHIH